ncbi:hypothetical protein HYDPIDRAFT_44616 [Hydnomerulius pinastri MD-312]|uniref:Uncharacterized protein n=1 Tax=Hydnomerulius pinastri MD-312 TaxID=994086 RepID=A0A0C9W751_9AGAM|nr:hypothetical protein HYDPIDRAFT_44616 [Hydnomerulius pinastri MD-312]
MKEGMFIYAFATASLIFVTIGVLVKDLPTRISALQANLATATTVVAICRVMLNIKSLAATAHVDPAWLLNHAELSRVYWRRGAADAEIFVEVGGGDIQLPVMPTSPAVPRTPASLGSMD